jgi:hypothetical protein
MATPFRTNPLAVSPRTPAPAGIWPRPAGGSSPLEVPELLLEATAILLARGPISLDDDVYLYGTHDQPLHPLLTDALLLVVDRRRRRIDPPHRQGARQRPLFLIETEDGRYICGLCSVEGGTLVIGPHPDIPAPSLRLRRADTTVIGQIVAVVRRFGAASRRV